MLLLDSAAETCSSFAGHWVGKETSPRLCHIARRLLQLCFGHGQVAPCSTCCSTSGHRDTEM